MRFSILTTAIFAAIRAGGVAGQPESMTFDDPASLGFKDDVAAPDSGPGPGVAGPAGKAGLRSRDRLRRSETVRLQGLKKRAAGASPQQVMNPPHQGFVDWIDAKLHIHRKPPVLVPLKGQPPTPPPPPVTISRRSPGPNNQPTRDVDDHLAHGSLYGPDSAPQSPRSRRDITNDQLRSTLRKRSTGLGDSVGPSQVRRQVSLGKLSTESTQ